MDTPRSRLNIFVVDDHQDAAASMAMVLRLHHAEVSVFFHGGDALDAALIEPPDLVLLDLIMPGIDGIETCDRLRQSPRMEQAVVFAITGSEHERQDALDSECFDAIFIKPVDPAELLEAMKVFVTFRRKERRREQQANGRRFAPWMLRS